jgi:hypothetical protein
MDDFSETPGGVAAVLTQLPPPRLRGPRPRRAHRPLRQDREALRSADADSYRLLALIAELDRLGGWKREGFAWCVSWLAYRTQLDKITAREKVRVARALTRLPKTSDAMGGGELSFSQGRAITRAADAESPEDETELLQHARTMSAAQRIARTTTGSDTVASSGPASFQAS